MALNRLLAAEPWARARLAPFAGETIELRNPPFPALRFGILAGGSVEPGGGEPALTVTLGPGAIISLARGPEHFLRSLQVTGDAKLAAEVLILARHLRWDAEEALSSVVGDVAAHRVAQAGRAFAAWQADALRRLVQSLSDYAVDETRILLPQADQDAFAAALARLRDAVERLEKRVERLE